MTQICLSGFSKKISKSHLKTLGPSEADAAAQSNATQRVQERRALEWTRVSSSIAGNEPSGATCGENAAMDTGVRGAGVP